MVTAQLLHQQPPTLKLIQLELDRSHFLCRLGVGSLDCPQHLTLAANEHDAPGIRLASLAGVSLDLGWRGGMAG
jgi:hypothetical protein